jgi:hypothetical protein
MKEEGAPLEAMVERLAEAVAAMDRIAAQRETAADPLPPAAQTQAERVRDLFGALRARVDQLPELELSAAASRQEALEEEIRFFLAELRRFRELAGDEP